MVSFIKKNYKGWLFVAPWVIGLLLFYAYPLFSSLYFSLTTYSILEPGKFIGLHNYQSLLKDPIFWQSIYNTVYFAVLFVPLSIFFGISLAMFLNMKVKGMAIYRTIYFLPTLVPHISVAVLWIWLLNPQFGLVNEILGFFGIQGPGWIGNENWSKPSLILMSLWGIGHSIVIYLAGLKDVPQDYYDAADVDGAHVFSKFFHITIPLMTPIIFYNLIMGIIGAFQQFTLPYSLTDGTGQPVGSLMFYVMYLYNNGFLYLKMGYASAMAWILFLIIMGLTGIIFYSSKKWVHYQGK